MLYDVAIVGGGPAGLSAALALGRARKRVLLCDSGPRRNSAAEHVQNFVTRDGIAPSEFRRIARQQLEAYASVEVRDARVEDITGERGAFEVRLATGSVQARRILLCTGMVDEMLDIDGFPDLWGKSIFQYPYCHGWEAQSQRFAYLAANAEMLTFPILLRGWTSEVAVLTDGKFEVLAELRGRLAAAGVRLEERRIAKLVAGAGRLTHIALEHGGSLPCEVLFVHPRQRQVELVRTLGLAFSTAGHVQVDELRRETSLPGVYAAGDLVTPLQAAVVAAASGAQAAGMLNHELTIELATGGLLG